MPAGPSAWSASGDVQLMRAGSSEIRSRMRCELDSQRGVFWMFFVNTRRLDLGLVRLLQSEGRHRLHDALEARAHIQRRPIELHLQDETAPSTGASRTELHGGHRI